MRLLAIEHKGSVPFGDTIRLDLTQFEDARLIAVCGANGSGKTTMLETLPRALRCMPPGVRPATTLWRDKTSYDQVEIELGGQRLRIRQTVDGVSRSAKREALVTDMDTGEPLIDSVLVTSFDEWAAENLPTAQTLHLTLFGGQSREGHAAPQFLHLPPRGKKDLILELLGCEHYERLATRAREHVRECESTERVLLGRLEELEETQSVEECEVAIGNTQWAVNQTRDELAQARRDLTLAEQRHKAWSERHAEIETARARHETAKRKAGEAKRRLEEAESKVASAREVVATADEVRDRARRLEEAEEADREARGDLSDATRDYDRADSDLKAATRERESKRAMLDDARNRVDAAERRLAQVRRSIGDLVAAETTPEDVAPLEAARDEARDRVAAAEGRVAELAGDRVGRLRGGLSQVVDATELEQARNVASRTLGADEDLGAARAQAEDALVNARAKLREAERLLSDAVERKRAAETRAARLADYRRDEETAQRDVSAATARADELQAEFDAAAKAVTHAQQLAIDHAANQSRMQARASETDALVRSLADARRNLNALERAEERLDALAPQLDALRRDAETAARELAQTPAPDDDTAPPDVEDERRAVAAAEKALEDAQADVTRAEAALERARARAERREKLSTELDELRIDAADWRRLEADLGRNGLQAFEVDAAGPELSRIATELLHAAYGSRWTLSIQTSRMSADGKKDIEDCFVSVIDTERGLDGSTSMLSGGQQVIANEAIRLALTVMACRRMGIDRPTLFRDESGAALDEDAGPRWLEMLRAAADMIGADKVLFVSHSSALWRLADVIVRVDDGALHID